MSPLSSFAATALCVVLAAACAPTVVIRMTAPATAAPPCTPVLRVGMFRAESAAGLHISDKGFHALGVLISGAEFMLDGSRVESDRFRSHLAKRFTQELTKALFENSRDLKVVVDEAALLSVSGTLFYREQHDVRFESDKGLGSEGERTQVTKILDAHLVLSDASGAVVTEITVNLAGPEEPRPVTSPKYQTRLAVWRAVEQLVRRRVRFDVPLAFAWSRDVRAGLRAADEGKWGVALEHWERATAAASPSTRRAAHFNMFVAHELAGRYDDAKTHLMAAQDEYPAAVGFASTSSGADEAGQRMVPPTDFLTHLWRLEQHGVVERCTAPAENLP